MPWTGLLLLVTNFCVLCHSSPVNISAQVIEQLMKNLEKREGGSLFDGLDLGEGDGDVLSPDAPGLGLDSGDGDGDSGQSLDSPVVPGKQDGIPKIPGLEKGPDGQLYFQGNRVKSISPLGGSDDNDEDTDDEDDDNNNNNNNNSLYYQYDDDNDDDDDDDDDGGGGGDDGDDSDDDNESSEEVVHDADGVIEPDVGWQDDDYEQNRGLNIHNSIPDIEGKIKSISPLKSIKELTNIQEISDISEIDQDIAERFIKTQGLINSLDKSRVSENRIVPAMADPVSEEDSMEDPMEDSSMVNKIKREIENENKMRDILEKGIMKEKKKLRALEKVKESHDVEREKKIQKYKFLVDQMKNRNIIDSSEEVQDIQEVKSMRNVKSIKPVSVQEVKSLQEVNNIYALTKEQAQALKRKLGGIMYNN